VDHTKYVEHARHVRTDREEYLRKVLLGKIACYCPYELVEAERLFAGELFVGAALWVGEWPYRLLRFERAGEGKYSQVWRVEGMFVLGKAFLLEIGPADEIREVEQPEPLRAKAAGV
jgi:hypothetical protein